MRVNTLNIVQCTSSVVYEEKNSRSRHRRLTIRICNLQMKEYEYFTTNTSFATYMLCVMSCVCVAIDTGWS